MMKIMLSYNKFKCSVDKVPSVGVGITIRDKYKGIPSHTTLRRKGKGTYIRTFNMEENTRIVQ